MTDTTLVVPGPSGGLPQGTPPDDYLTWGQIVSLFRRRWLTVAVTVAVCAGLALAYAAKAAPVYEAGAVLQLEKEQYNLPEMVTNHATDEGELSTELEVLRSSRLAATTVQDLALNVQLRDSREPRSRYFSSLATPGAVTPGTLTLTRVAAQRFTAVHSGSGERSDSIVPGRPALLGGVAFTLREVAAGHDEIVLDVQSTEAATAAFQGQLKVGRGDRNANTIWVRYRSGDPELTSASVALLTSQYIENRTDRAREKVRTAVRFLREEADTLRRQMQQADQALHDFRQREGVVSLSDEASSAVNQGALLRTTRATMEAERSALQQLVSQADTNASAYRRLTAFPTLIGNPVVANLLRTVDELEGQRTTLLVQRTPRDPDVQAVARRIGEADAQLRGVTLTYLSGLQKQVASLDQALTTQSRVAASLPGKSMQEDQLSRAPRVLADVYTLVETRLQEARIAESAADAGVALIDAPSLPSAPVWPRRGLLLAVGLAAGLLAGVALAWMREGLDASIHSRADVTRASELPVLTVVPHIKATQHLTAQAGEASGMVIAPPRQVLRQLPVWRTPMPKRQRIDERQTSGAIREAYTWLETSLALTHTEGDAHVVAFTSALAREGKTVSVANLAVSAAQHGQRVLLIDADLRRGPLHEVFGISRSPGLSDVLAGSATIGDAIREIAVDSGTVSLLPRGRDMAHPTRLLTSERLQIMLAALRPHHDLILIDSPPVNLVSDPLLLVRQVDGVVLVARAGITESSALSQAVRHLRDAGAPLLGVLLNDINMQRDSSYDEAYRYLDQAGAYAAAGEA